MSDKKKFESVSKLNLMDRKIISRYWRTISDNKAFFKQAEKYELTQQGQEKVYREINRGPRWRININARDKTIKLEKIDEQKFNRENEQLSEFDLNCFQKNEQCKSSDFSTHAKKLPKEIRGFLKDEELQAYCIERRQAWYGDKSLNFWTHLIVRLKTWRFVIVEFICKQSIANIRHRFQPLHQPRLPRN